MSAEEIDHFLADTQAVADGVVVLRVPVLIGMVVLSAVGISHFILLDMKAGKLRSQRIVHMCRLRVRHMVAGGRIQYNRRRVTCRTVGY